MRLTNFLFVAAAALLASCEAVSAGTDSTQTKLSTMTSPDVVQAVEATHAGKRFLRTTKKEKYDDGGSDDDDLDSEDEDEDEERMVKKELGTSPQNTKLINLYAAVMMRNSHVQRVWS
ncbi:hypothetical protein BBJ29_007455 [Phytophthora kernoviae]|uniref:RxLR effector protein n=1 Tax=Phytophthora kernoviae TaxID=325452 RepID=A0A3F2RGP9_9STRA|nr:hypothetical protein BBJ29_007455 [Phytophthora kernoviae]RLN54988.1 hypothetical protein BBP00_00008690 [Phytophthora kernoviae]